MATDPQLPPVVDVILELGIKRIRTAIGDGPMNAYVPRMVLWVDQANGMIVQFALSEPLDNYLRPVLESLEKAVDLINGMPREIRLRDVKLAGELRKVLEKFGVSVVVREDLPGLDQAFGAMADMKGLSSPPEPGLLDVSGMKLDHVHAFAEAARAFYEARPWRLLNDEDLIKVESPAGPRGTQFTMVLGEGGQTYGLGFVATRAAHDEMRAGGLPKGGVWSLQFGDIDDLPFDDGEMWAEKNLPVAGPDAYPSFLKYTRSKAPQHPTPEELIWAEGLLRAVAQSTEDELDSGRWEKTVETFNGPVTYKLSLPVLLEQMSGKKRSPANMDLSDFRTQMESMMRGLAQQLEERGGELPEGGIGFEGKTPEFEPKTDAERAQALAYEARQSRGRRELQLARQALAIDPECVDAMLILAERRRDPEQAIPLLQRAVEAGEKRLGPEFFEENAGDFWGLLETRPYMRARERLAVNLFEAGRMEEAAGHLRELLRLNPNDNQGNRYLLAQTLLRTNQLDELDNLLNRLYGEEDMAEWAFTRALLEFRRGGDTPEARKRLEEAARSNPHVLPLLTGRRMMPPLLPPHYSPGSEDEAMITVSQILDSWVETPDALEWLEKAAPKPARKPRGSKGKKGPGKRRK